MPDLAAEDAGDDLQKAAAVAEGLREAVDESFRGERGLGQWQEGAWDGARRSARRGAAEVMIGRVEEDVEGLYLAQGFLDGVEVFFGKSVDERSIADQETEESVVGHVVNVSVDLGDAADVKMADGITATPAVERRMLCYSCTRVGWYCHHIMKLHD